METLFDIAKHKCAVIYSYHLCQGRPLPHVAPHSTFAEVVPGPLHGILEIAISEVGVISEATVQANGVGEEHNARAAYNFLCV